MTKREARLVIRRFYTRSKPNLEWSQRKQGFLCTFITSFLITFLIGPIFEIKTVFAQHKPNEPVTTCQPSDNVSANDTNTLSNFSIEVENTIGIGLDDQFSLSVTGSTFRDHLFGELSNEWKSSIPKSHQESEVSKILSEVLKGEFRGGVREVPYFKGGLDNPEYSPISYRLPKGLEVALQKLSQGDSGEPDFEAISKFIFSQKRESYDTVMTPDEVSPSYSESALNNKFGNFLVDSVDSFGVPLVKPFQNFLTSLEEEEKEKLRYGINRINLENLRREGRITEEDYSRLLKLAIESNGYSGESGNAAFNRELSSAIQQKRVEDGQKDLKDRQKQISKDTDVIKSRIDQLSDQDQEYNTKLLEQIKRDREAAQGRRLQRNQIRIENNLLSQSYQFIRNIAADDQRSQIVVKAANDGIMAFREFQRKSQKIKELADKFEEIRHSTEIVDKAEALKELELTEGISEDYLSLMSIQNVLSIANTFMSIFKLFSNQKSEFQLVMEKLNSIKKDIRKLHEEMMNQFYEIKKNQRDILNGQNKAMEELLRIVENQIKSFAFDKVVSVRSSDENVERRNARQPVLYGGHDIDAWLTRVREWHENPKFPSSDVDSLYIQLYHHLHLEGDDGFPHGFERKGDYSVPNLGSGQSLAAEARYALASHDLITLLVALSEYKPNVTTEEVGQTDSGNRRNEIIKNYSKLPSIEKLVEVVNVLPELVKAEVKKEENQEGKTVIARKYGKIHEDLEYLAPKYNIYLPRIESSSRDLAEGDKSKSEISRSVLSQFLQNYYFQMKSLLETLDCLGQRYRNTLGHRGLFKQTSNTQELAQKENRRLKVFRTVDAPDTSAVNRHHYGIFRDKIKIFGANERQIQIARAQVNYERLKKKNLEDLEREYQEQVSPLLRKRQSGVTLDAEELSFLRKAADRYHSAKREVEQISFTDRWEELHGGTVKDEVRVLLEDNQVGRRKPEGITPIDITNHRFLELDEALYEAKRQIESDPAKIQITPYGGLVDSDRKIKFIEPTPLVAYIAEHSDIVGSMMELFPDQVYCAVVSVREASLKVGDEIYSENRAFKHSRFKVSPELRIECRILNQPFWRGKIYGDKTFGRIFERVWHYGNETYDTGGKYGTQKTMRVCKWEKGSFNCALTNNQIFNNRAGLFRRMAQQWNQSDWFSLGHGEQSSKKFVPKSFIDRVNSEDTPFLDHLKFVPITVNGVDFSDLTGSSFQTRSRSSQAKTENSPHLNNQISSDAGSIDSLFQVLLNPKTGQLDDFSTHDNSHYSVDDWIRMQHAERTVEVVPSYDEMDITRMFNARMRLANFMQKNHQDFYVLISKTMKLYDGYIKERKKGVTTPKDKFARRLAALDLLALQLGLNSSDQNGDIDVCSYEYFIEELNKVLAFETVLDNLLSNDIEINNNDLSGKGIFAEFGLDLGNRSDSLSAAFTKGIPRVTTLSDWYVKGNEYVLRKIGSYKLRLLERREEASSTMSDFKPGDDKTGTLLDFTWSRNSFTQVAPYLRYPAETVTHRKTAYSTSTYRLEFSEEAARQLGEKSILRHSFEQASRAIESELKNNPGNLGQVKLEQGIARLKNTLIELGYE